jgi:Asp-tRNA(Asn)/Glu-tRNA(Gln) amidotransferase A subunit family amidase
MSLLKPIPPGLLHAFRAFEGAIAAGDAATLDRLYADSATTLRGDADGLLVGHDAITAAGPTATAHRTVVQTHVQVIDDDHALVVAVTEAAAGGRGLETQLWARSPEHGWQVTAAQVSGPPPAYDARVWRVVGDPLVPATDDDGPLSGETVAVKDLYAVQGHRVGAGSPEWLHHATPEPAHATAVARLLAAGADLRGIARTDELAYSLAGTNAHYGTPPNPRAPHRVPGGSSSGSATAVALGHASIGLGSDTGGSVRVPAAYQGLYGIRTTHGAVDRTGLLPLAPSFDTVGWLTRSAFLLQAVGDVLLPESAPSGSTDLVVVPDLLRLAQPDVGAAVTGWLPDTAASEQWPLHRLDDWRVAFQTWQAYEAWQSHGEWLATRLDTVGAAVRARFERGRDTDEATALAARQSVDNARAVIRELVGDRVLVLPSAAATAPLPADAEAGRDETIRLTCLAGLGGLPAVSLPVRTDAGLPAGVCLVAAPGRDRDLLALAVELGREGR